jgi:hypothetical protein
MFPILRMLRSHFENAKIIVIATAILHNIAIKFGEVEPEEDDEVLDLLRAVIQQMDTPEVEAHRAVEQAAEAAARDAGVPGVADPGRRIEGQLHRDQLKLNMPPQGRRRVARNLYFVALCVTLSKMTPIFRIFCNTVFHKSANPIRL